jgi:hypothetical protein
VAGDLVSGLKRWVVVAGFISNFLGNLLDMPQDFARTAIGFQFPMQGERTAQSATTKDTPKLKVRTTYDVTKID